MALETMIAGEIIQGFYIDKLVALSGIAKHFANKYSSEYLAGIWKEHLPHALVWSADDEHGTGPLPLRGPSWSWASRNGSIRYDRIYSFVKTPFDDRPSSWTASDFKILDVQVQTTTSDSYGHCLGGEMRIECVKLIDGTGVSDGVYPGRSSKTIPIGDESFSINYYFDDRREHSKIFLLKIFTRIVQERSEAIYQWTPEIQGRPSPPSSHANGIHDCEEGLIIAPVVGRKGTFTRIGIYHLPGYIGTLQAFEDARSKTESLQEDELSLYEQGSGVNEAGNQSYVITLI
ncbi:hypothetical protein SS1G_10083 [Sclerotinia sclerotiorum 1980 UF-70]|uniref:Uncharacterized protein n=1 Tax=Sclerotinia sclerotiorum (strain ATCC 18683 / 1980 / Ss-1) TaxID=665079 RepID=A7EXL8_SCLS1|nr:hypothetical protein SS1G_10083 [Sclerotinia sclerotiorum 1980 UF-70]EDN94210.1 hypothetical protein SS1G_10083 [Sclerotinia sclerotiorum 1980 UF-70]